jgi:hypothetical protein
MVGNTYTTVTRRVESLSMVLPNFALCHNWIFAKSEWEDHCQAHLNNPETLPIQCDPLVHGGVLATSGYCDFCLNDTSLPAAERMKQLPLRDKWKEHINECFNEHVQDWDGQPLHCPYSCKGAFDSPLRLQFHLQDVHCYEFIKERKGLKRSRHDDEMDTKPVRKKRQRSGYTRERGVGSAVPVKLEYDFIYETVEVKGPQSICPGELPDRQFRESALLVGQFSQDLPPSKGVARKASKSETPLPRALVHRRQFAPAYLKPNIN